MSDWDITEEFRNEPRQFLPLCKPFALDFRKLDQPLKTVINKLTFRILEANFKEANFTEAKLGANSTENEPQMYIQEPVKHLCWIFK